ncbi:FAD-dependent pyridine nucleotide-disulfide oxidoreductase [Bacillus methanolicus PB1]|uniref:FAD-dependent pyridine nucleotide-disulfide oxidoreductase n=1 Tax=Bacillus methanolicus PB1 TaxID=997296 RepID=I3E1C9_BACMT|nr:NAD(P)/FAD-dependent oxidoreductase [Bacillus methanolicus]EIJ80300.1 FAD-dependent pyridine nucleotide-disulfide oxidoreductase [Bacillus methanolicus PB1]
MQQNVDVLVIGAGQAGLAMGYYLKQKNILFAIVGKENRIGDVWRNRYDSLVLFTPRWFSSLPGMALMGDQNGNATRDEIADYLEDYAQKFELPVHLNKEVISVHKENGTFKVTTNNGNYVAEKVVVATGPFQKPYIPPFADSLSDNVYQVHTSRYLNSSQLLEGSVLVVGAGNSGAQIAVELSKDREVFLSVGHKMKFFPLEIMGKSIFWWFKKLGLLNSNINSKLGQIISKQSDPIFGKELKYLIQEDKIKVKPRTESISEDIIYFQDNSQIQVQNLIWATGFYSDYSWIQIPNVLDHKGKPVHNRGVTSVKGLYFLGLPWQYRRGSALIGGVGTDAEYLINDFFSH